MCSGVTRVGDTRGGKWGGHTSIFSWKTWRPFCHYHYRFLLFSLGCHPLQCVTPHLFYLSDLVSPLFFVNLPTKFFSFGCHLPGGCHPRRSASPPRSPLSDATANVLTYSLSLGYNYTNDSLRFWPRNVIESGQSLRKCLPVCLSSVSLSDTLVESRSNGSRYRNMLCGTLCVVSLG